ncbi:hypothetical protein [Dryocola sp. BD613]|uniref:hypothetical protein n=1 Tax=Dryocola sp. BD613 TaxID=3133272 RepID=UPI003F4FB59A
MHPAIITDNGGWRVAYPPYRAGLFASEAYETVGWISVSAIQRLLRTTADGPLLIRPTNWHLVFVINDATARCLSAPQNAFSFENPRFIAQRSFLYDFVTYSIVFCYEKSWFFAPLLMFAASMIRCKRCRSQNKSFI